MQKSTVIHRGCGTFLLPIHIFYEGISFSLSNSSNTYSHACKTNPVKETSLSRITSSMRAIKSTGKRSFALFCKFWYNHVEITFERRTKS